MSNVKSDHNNKQGQSSIEDVNARRIDQITEVMDNYTRTQRHLEQYSHIGDPENVDNARKIQQEREDEINHLKNLVAYGDSGKDRQDEIDNLKKNYEYTEGYIDHNKDHMNEQSLENTMEKQRHRKEQLDNLK